MATGRYDTTRRRASSVLPEPRPATAQTVRAGQCQYAFEKIQRVLGYNGATLKDITNMTTYLTSAKNIRPYVACRDKIFDAAGAKLPAETLLIISRLAWPPMMLEVEITAITAK